MAGDRPVTFDEPTARRLIGLLRDRRNDVTPLRQEVPACVPTARRHRWAKATTNYLHPTFPTSGNVVLVEFGEYQFSAPTGVNQTVSPTWVPYTSNPYDGSGFALAIVPTGGTMPSNGEVVRVLFVIDACDREIIAWSAIANGGVSGEMVRDLMAYSPPEKMREIMLTLARDSNERVRVYDAGGKPLFDSAHAGGPGYTLVDPTEEPLKRQVARFLDQMVDWIVRADPLPPFEEPEIGRAHV